MMSTNNTRVLIAKALASLEELQREALQKSCACKVCMKVRNLQAQALLWLREALEEAKK